jgi:hypothetical protein
MSRDELIARCDMGVGCDEAGVCYAEAHGQPERCPKSVSTVVRISVGNVKCCHLPDYLALVPASLRAKASEIGTE